MSYHRYLVPGLVLNTSPRGEANSLFQILTAEFGLIRVSAQGIRLEKSKLRYGLQNYSLVRVELVRGRDFWRLIGAEPIYLANPKQKNLGRKLATILLRLLPEEEPNQKIFSDLQQAWDLLRTKEPDNFLLSNLEIFLLLRLLSCLGYLASEPLVEAILRPQEFSYSDFALQEGSHLAFIRLINRALSASGL